MVLLAACMCLGLFVLSAGLPPDLREGSNDLTIYRGGGESILLGRVPYRDFSIEYPPGILPALILPALFSAGREGYTNLFSSEMAVMLAAALVLTATTARTLRGPRAWLLTTGTFAAAALALYPVALTRYDALVALTLGLAAFFARPGGRYLLLAYASLGLGAAAKLVPALATLALAFARRGAAIGFAVFVGVLAVCFVPFIGSRGLLDSFAYQTQRGLQVESLPASVLISLRTAHGVAFEYGAFEVVGTGVGFATSLSPLLTLGLLSSTAIVMYSERRRFGGSRAEDFPRHAAALILAFMLGSKVLSPQYMIWLLPLVPLSAGGVTGIFVCAAFLAACLLTTQVFPLHYADLLAFRFPGPELLLARNLLLVVLWVTMLALPAVAREERPT